MEAQFEHKPVLTAEKTFPGFTGAGGEVGNSLCNTLLCGLVGNTLNHVSVGTG